MKCGEVPRECHLCELKAFAQLYYKYKKENASITLCERCAKKIKMWPSAACADCGNKLFDTSYKLVERKVYTDFSRMYLFCSDECAKRYLSLNEIFAREDKKRIKMEKDWPYCYTVVMDSESFDWLIKNVARGV